MNASTKKPASRQIVGISLDKETALAFKTEASRRGLTLRKLFKEMWSTYESGASKKSA